MIRGVAILTTCMIAAAAACGGHDRSANSPAGPTPPESGTTGATITISNNAVSPKNLTVSVGTQVTFINNDSQAHDMESDPHPVHTDCPAINQVGFLTPGQRRQTGPLNTVTTCGYHDHNRDMVESLQGTITVR